MYIVMKTRIDLRSIGIIVLGTVLFCLTALRPVGYPISLLMVGFTGVTLARLLLRPRAWLDLVIASWTAGVAVLLLIAEALSLLTLLGSPTAWVIASGVAAAAASVAASLRPAAWPAGQPRVDVSLPWWAWIWPGTFLVLLATTFTLTWFAGINIPDTLVAYLPRSVRYLQDGTLSAYSTYFDTTPYLHQILVAHQMVFLRSDALVNPLSFFTVLSISTTLYAFTRSLHWHGYLPLLTACMPFTMPAVLMHASTSNFDTLEASWLLLSLYFLRRGAPGLTPRWLLFAALATALALATKPTFWFAAPGLGLVWVAVAVRSLRRRGLNRTARWLAMAAVVILIVGAPYLIRNMIVHGTPLGREFGSVQSYVLGPPVTLGDGVRRIIFTNLALATELMTPPFLFGSLSEEPANAWFRSMATWLGYELPDQRWTFYGLSWDTLLRHGFERYASGHAFFGAAFVLVLVPSLVALVVRWRALGPRRPILASCLFVALTYPAILAALFRYDLQLGRYLIEMVAVLTVVAPIIFAVLPKRVAAGYALLISTVLLAEMYDVIIHNRQMIIDTITTIPREEQYYRQFGLDSPATLTASRALKQKYPAAEFPDVYIDFINVPEVLDYPFLGPALDRRTHYWKAPPNDPPAPPGLFLTTNPLLVAQMAERRDISIDRLSLNTWMIMPNDRLRVVYSMVRPSGNGPMTLKMRAAAPATGYERPEYRFAIVTPTSETVVQEFSANPDAMITFDKLVTVRIEARDAGGSLPVLTYFIDPRRYLDL